jgi:hypothetical protein
MSWATAQGPARNVRRDDRQPAAPPRCHNAEGRWATRAAGGVQHGHDELITAAGKVQVLEAGQGQRHREQEAVAVAFHCDQLGNVDHFQRVAVDVQGVGDGLQSLDTDGFG